MHNKFMKRFILTVLFLLWVVPIAIAQTNKFALYEKYITFLDDTPDSVKQFFYFRTACKKNFVAITFDDGPIENTKLIIDLLEKENVPATFFLVCEKLDSENVHLYKKPLFEVGMHTFNHGNYRKLTKSEIENDIKQCILKFEDLYMPLDYFRPAYGIMNSVLVSELRKKQIKGILWNIDSLDWNDYEGDKLIDQVIHNLSPGSIIIFHDRVDKNDLKKIIKEIRTKNFKIVSLKTIVQFEREYP